MQPTLRPYAAAGVAILGSSLIAATPLVAPLPDLLAVQSQAVQLTAGGDDAWSDVFSQAQANSQQLIQNFALAPFVNLQQAIVNHTDFAKAIASDPSNITSATMEMQEHAKDAASSFTLTNADSDTVSAVENHTLNNLLDISGLGNGFITAGHSLILGEIGSFLPTGTDLDKVQPILDFLSSPASAVLIGFLGPILSPWVGLINSITAGNGLSADLAGFVGGLLNGADLNLDSLAPAVSKALGTEVNNLDLSLGGLLSTGGGNFQAGNSSADHDYTVLNSDGDVIHSVDPVGGSLFNSLGLTLTVPSALGISGPLVITIPSGGIGPIGALEEVQQVMGVMLGSGWDGSGADASAPLFSLPDLLSDAS